MNIYSIFSKRSANNATQVTINLLKALNVRVTSTTITEVLEQHPDYPSLLSITDCLKKWEIDNIALNVAPEKLHEIPTPFIAHSKVGKGNFILVTNFNGSITYLDDTGQQRQKRTTDFFKEWDNVVLIAEPGKNAGEENYKKKYLKELTNKLRIPGILLMSLILITIFSFQIDSLAGTIFSLIKLSGIIVTGGLLWYETDKSNPFLREICSIGKLTNCSAVLQSKHAKFFGIISWSEIGFFYYAGSFIFLLTSITNYSSSLAVVSYLNLLTLPYPLFSIFYQWRIIKQWCPLCLIIQGLLLLEFCTAYFGFWRVSSKIISFPAFEILPLIISFLLPLVFWIVAKPFINDALKAELYRKEVTKFKFNRVVFQSMLERQKRIHTSPEGLGITIGHPNAKYELIKVCNPYCKPCSAAHLSIEQLIKTNSIKVRILFTSTNDENDVSKHPAKLLMALYQQEPREKFEKALDEWYLTEKKDFKLFSGKYPLEIDSGKVSRPIDEMSNWCKDQGIEATPTIFINGYQLPGGYKIKDLEYLLT
jgi:uncharacterized membrane protein